MAKPGYRTLSSRMVGKMKVSKDTVFWDRGLPGFGVRVYPSGSKVYVAQARGPKGVKRVVVGRHGVIHAEEARKRAASIITRMKSGEAVVSEPAKPAGGPSVGDLVRRYMEEHAAIRYKPGSVKMVRSVLYKHIVPALGRLPLAAVERAQVAELHQRLYKTPFTANMVVRTLSLMYRLAEGWGMAPKGCNPCRSIIKYPERKRERFLTDNEFTRLGRVLEEAVSLGLASAPAAAAIRLLMLTGCRKNEILTLRWENVALNESEFRLSDAKTGARVVSLSPPALKLLAGLPRAPGNPWVFSGKKTGGRIHEIDTAWNVIRSRANLDDVRIHDLRHSFASRALALGESLPVIGKLLGHTQIETTARYAHLTPDSVREAAERIAASIAADIFGETWRPVSSPNIPRR
ncbi:MAG: site-specific integrase [Nitrospinae bacterium]|nr:site-specific integrase [Nitrospinota bacterium]